MLGIRFRSWHFRQWAVLLTSVSLLFSGSTILAKPVPRLKRTPRYAPDRIIVKYRRGVGNDRKAEIRGRIGASTIRTLKSSGAAVLKLQPGMDVDKAIERLQSDPDVIFARRDHYLRIHRTCEGRGCGGDK